MTTVLDDIITGVRADMAARMAVVAPSQLKERIRWMGPTLDPRPGFGGDTISVISEVKRSSPSKGALATIEDPATIASAYEAGGAAAISVLTERHRFNGTPDDLRAVREAVGIPVLRKDFVVDPYQVLEARAFGADLVLLIVAALDDKQLAGLYDLALSLGLLPLIEVHTAEEMRRAALLKPELVGVNNRNLKTLDVDLAQFERLAPLAPHDAIVVAESGIRDAADVQRVRAAGADVVLVGEALVTSGNPREAVQTMIEATRPGRGPAGSPGRATVMNDDRQGESNE
ncbi:indole-3-glycerol phosphate synthase TrpC [Propionibacterium freudenreichii]|uniref:Indole-3-glycerol phosphate synthase n=1 Tax=Propionibacterium freudenreichii TaxID=1744 RepID=A0A2C7YZF7_9ACTN|nr:indole-3-glycerol phosphate synthase TrpC [Propionibacterium freudenreichii]MCT2973935.1 indole-3-glycerol phosphate synthase TrpC [Propionibacterium freudenreichii]MCT2975725.1 indole-3-glycerol phosphate synthase TrpC [Propionibacterium freudenreichii]MCT2977840.1 indole-3-glycerol phosphate synthase TrpC [Propionibacterium freudenreichii]MCT2983664.1 indole-3-glycerol phosphate synthase TrpC [Propionibacterium freudenreichii]MCT2986286.1 indole-3-glycerol phosphate synthase TrpC [Propion